MRRPTPLGSWIVGRRWRGPFSLRLEPLGRARGNPGADGDRAALWADPTPHRARVPASRDTPSRPILSRSSSLLTHNVYLRRKVCFGYSHGQEWLSCLGSQRSESIRYDRHRITECVDVVDETGLRGCQLLRRWSSPRVSVEQTLLVIDLDAVTQTGGKQAKAVQPERLSPEAPTLSGDAIVRSHGNSNRERVAEMTTLSS